jgi:hypothetical protein
MRPEVSAGPTDLNLSPDIETSSLFFSVVEFFLVDWAKACVASTTKPAANKMVLFFIM